MALDMTPEQKAIGRTNMHQTVGMLATETPPATADTTRRQFMQGLIAAGAVAPLSAAAYFGYSQNFTERPVRAAIIGTGDEGGVLVGEHNPRFLEFVAYCDVRPSNQRRIFVGQPGTPRRGFNHHYGNNASTRIRRFDSTDELLADTTLGIEAVVIALPLHLHASETIKALRAGKHVLCEKLMAWNVRQCKDMIQAADQSGKLLSIGHQRHYSLLYAHAVEVLNSGVLGDVRHIRALWHRNNAQPRLSERRTAVDPETGCTYVVDEGGQPQRDGNQPAYRDSWRPAIAAEDRTALPPARLEALGYRSIEELVRWRLYDRTGGGLMAELGSHQLDACSIFLGKVRPLAVSGVGGKYFYKDDREVEDHVFCTFEFPGKNYWADESRRQVRDANDIVIVTYSSINTNAFEPYGECVMGTAGTLVVESEQSAMLWGGAGRGTAVTVTASGGPALVSSSSETPASQAATRVGATAMGDGGAVSRGYREEMEHFAYLIRTRDQVMGAEREQLKPRCDGRAAMADAIMALTANIAMKRKLRVEFQPSWYDPAQLGNEAQPDAVR